MENRKIRKIRRKIIEAHNQGRYASEAKLMLELERMENEVQLEREHISLAAAAGNDHELCNALSTKLVETNIYADLLYMCVMEFRDMLPKDVVSMEYLTQCTNLVKMAHDVVASIDDVGDPKLSEHYANMTQEVEDKVVYYLRNTISNIMNKRIEFK